MTTTLDDLPPLLTAGEVAQLYRMPIASLYGLRHKKKPPGSLGFTRGRKLLFDKTDILADIARAKKEH